MIVQGQCSAGRQADDTVCTGVAVIITAVAIAAMLACMSAVTVNPGLQIRGRHGHVGAVWLGIADGACRHGHATTQRRDDQRQYDQCLQPLVFPTLHDYPRVDLFCCIYQGNSRDNGKLPGLLTVGGLNSSTIRGDMGRPPVRFLSFFYPIYGIYGLL